MKETEEVESLWHTRCGANGLLRQQRDRFQFIKQDTIPLDQGSVSWCETEEDAMQFCNFYRDANIKAHVLHDLAQINDEPDAPLWGWCVHTDVPFD